MFTKILQKNSENLQYFKSIPDILEIFLFKIQDSNAKIERNSIISVSYSILLSIVFYCHFDFFLKTHKNTQECEYTDVYIIFITN